MSFFAWVGITLALCGKTIDVQKTLSPGGDQLPVVGHHGPRAAPARAQPTGHQIQSWQRRIQSRQSTLWFTLRDVPHRGVIALLFAILARGILSKVTESWLSKRTSVRNRAGISSECAQFFPKHRIKAQHSGQLYNRQAFISLRFWDV